jgi:2-iminobutanoate/2-iminopropanoate deaminase
MSHHRETVTALGAPDAVGPYSHAVKAGGLLFISGQIPLDPESGELVGDSPPDQARRCLENLSVIAAAGGCSLADDAVKLTVYLTDIAAFNDVNEVYGSFFPSDPPARVAYAVPALPKGRFKVKITVTTSTGKKLTGTRRYHTCVKKRKPHRPPKL